MNFKLLPLLIMLCLTARTFATHNIAGEITYEFISANTIKATITTYTKESSVAADRDSLPVHWGDGSADDIISRTNGPLGASGVPNGAPIGNGIKQNVYIGIHTYASASLNTFYIISMTDFNRNDGILNINQGSSVNVPFYIEDTVWFRGQGLDHGPLLLYPPIDFANVGDTFFHNATAYDLEADSLSFDLITPLEGLGSTVPGYISPAQIISMPGDTLTIDRLNGMITWVAPRQSGIYSIAIMIREFRDGILLSTTIRDMAIVVRADTSLPSPLNGNFVDTTILSGQYFELPCTSTDPDPAHINTLSATGGPFVMLPTSATFTSTPSPQPTGLMTWTPGHNLYKTRETHIVTIRSLTNAANPLATLRSFRITVVDSSVNTGISDASDLHTYFTLYPNPAQDRLFADVVFQDFTISDITGRVYVVPYSQREIDVSSLSAGVYCIRLQDGAGIVMRRFLKE